MSLRKIPILSVKVSNSVQFTFAALAGVSAGYFLWKWLGEEYQLPKSHSKKQKTVPGLVNVGNSCFMNALLQAFASCPSYMNWLKLFVEKTEGDNEHVYLAKILLRVLKMLTGDTEVSNYYFDPSELLLDMGGRGWEISSQEQDAHEFYHAVMTTLIEEYQHFARRKTNPLGLLEIEELLLKNPSPSLLPRVTMEETLRLHNPSFRGTLACALQCQTCGHQNPVRYDGFDSLSLPLPSGFSWSAEISLMDCLTGFTASELVQNVECENCARLQISEISMKQRHQNMNSDKFSGSVNPQGTAVSSVNPDTLCYESSGLASRKSTDMALDEETVCNTKQASVSETVNLGTENSVEILSPQKSGSEKLSQGCDRQSMVARNSEKNSCKRPFPKLSFTTQKQSFESDFRRRFSEKTSENTAFCDEKPFISVRRLFHRRLSLAKLPQCLCIHLQRLVWVRGTPMKKMNFVRFPEILDVGPVTEISRVSKQNPKKCENWFQEDVKNLTPTEMQKVLLRRREMRSGGDSPDVPSSALGAQGRYMKTQEPRPGISSSHKALYRLMSVIVHLGDWSFSGHFLAYRRSPEQTGRESEWFVTSDTLVRRATMKEVLSCPAYMLFYEKIAS